MEEPALADVDAAEELPVAFQVRVHHAIGGARRKALEPFVQLARAEHGQHHELVEIGAAALDADLLAHDGMAAVAADDVVRLQDLSSGAAFLGDGDAHAAVVLLDRFRRPAEAALDVGQLRHPRPQHLFRLVLRQPLVVLEVIGVDDLAPRRRVPVLAHQVAVGGDAADRDSPAA